MMAKKHTFLPTQVELYGKIDIIFTFTWRRKVWSKRMAVKF